MVTKKNTTDEQAEKKGRVELNQLKLNKETVKDLSGSEAKKIKGGARAQPLMTWVSKNVEVC
jgi:hypothetical protein